MPTPGMHQSKEAQTNHRNSSTNYTSVEKPPIQSSSQREQQLSTATAALRILQWNVICRLWTLSPPEIPVQVRGA